MTNKFGYLYSLWLTLKMLLTLFLKQVQSVFWKNVSSPDT